MPHEQKLGAEQADTHGSGILRGLNFLQRADIGGNFNQLTIRTLRRIGFEPLQVEPCLRRALDLVKIIAARGFGRLGKHHALGAIQGQIRGLAQGFDSLANPQNSRNPMRPRNNGNMRGGRAACADDAAYAFERRARQIESANILRHNNRARRNMLQTGILFAQKGKTDLAAHRQHIIGTGIEIGIIHAGKCVCGGLCRQVRSRDSIAPLPDQCGHVLTQDLVAGNFT